MEQPLDPRLSAIVGLSAALVRASPVRLSDFAGPTFDAVFALFPGLGRAVLMLGNDLDSMKPFAIRQRQDCCDFWSPPRSLLRAALDKRELVIFHSPDASVGDGPGSPVIRSAMVVPMKLGNKVLALLVMDSPDPGHRFTSADAEVAICVAAMFALVLAYELRDPKGEPRCQRDA